MAECGEQSPLTLNSLFWSAAVFGRFNSIICDNGFELVAQ